MDQSHVLSATSKSQLEALDALGTIQGKIDAIAFDIPFGDRFNLIPPGILATKLRIDLCGACDEYAEVAVRMSIDEFDFDSVAEHLEDLLPAERVAVIREEGTFDVSELEGSDLLSIESGLTLSRLGDFNGDYPWVKRWHLVASDGKQVSFQVCQGDGGHPTDLRGPYQIAVLGFEFGDDYVVSEFVHFR